MQRPSARNVVIAAIAGLAIALAAAWFLNRPTKPQPPAFQPAANPFPKAIYATGIIESAQGVSSNVNINPQVNGRIVKVFVKYDEQVRAGQPLFLVDDSVQRGIAEQARLQSEAALALLEELKAEPRKEVLEVSIAQYDQANANVVTLAHQRDKIRRSYELDKRSVSKTALDTAEDSVAAAIAGAQTAKRQLELTRAGAWIYDIRNQEHLYESLRHASDAAQALLDQYLVKAPTDGVVLAINAPVGSYVSGLGTYDTYTQADVPVAVMSTTQAVLQVRVYVDEILLTRLQLPRGGARAEMIIRGGGQHVPLKYAQVQPYVVPKIELSDQRQERVDVRVLPVIFRFDSKPSLKLYPGQQVDVYIEER
jgi:HlyD family secretion protein